MVMATLAWVFGVLGLFSLALGMMTALELIPLIAPALTSAFLMTAATNLLLIAIACAIPASRPRVE